MKEQMAYHTLKEHYFYAEKRKEEKFLDKDNAINIASLMTILWKNMSTFLKREESIKTFWTLEKILSKNKYLLEFDHMNCIVYIR